MHAAVAIKEELKRRNIKGKIRLYGTPAEEGGSGKVYIARDGYFDDVDVVLHWHPDDSIVPTIQVPTAISQQGLSLKVYQHMLLVHHKMEGQL